MEFLKVEDNEWEPLTDEIIAAIKNKCRFYGGPGHGDRLAYHIAMGDLVIWPRGESFSVPVYSMRNAYADQKMRELSYRQFQRLAWKIVKQFDLEGTECFQDEETDFTLGFSVDFAKY